MVYMWGETFKLRSKSKTQIYALYKDTPKMQWFRKIKESCFLSCQKGKYEHKEAVRQDRI